MAGMMQGQGAVSPFKIGAWRIYEPYLEKKINVCTKNSPHSSSS